MKLSVKLFAQAKELAGTHQVELNLENQARVVDLRNALGRRYPSLEPLLSHLMIAVDSRYAADEEELTETQEIACFPPVSGG